MRHLASIMLCFILIGCGEPQIDSTPSDVYLYELALDLVNGAYIPFPIYFSDFEGIEDGKIGLCKGIKSGARSIQIKRSTWDSFSELKQRALMLHELGHCLYNLSHVDGPKELMYPVIVGAIACIDINGQDECLDRAKYLGGLNE